MKIREALQEDIPSMVLMLAGDDIASAREDPSEPPNSRYLAAFDEIKRDANNDLFVGVIEDQIVGMLQLTYIPYLTYVGSWRCLVEGVRVHRKFRGEGIGAKLFAWAIERARTRKCKIIQLTSDKKRADALRFYQKLGFVASHEGFKLHLD